MIKAFLLPLLFITSVANAAWTPPDHPDPTKILQEAQADAAAGRYEDALTKQIWYHQNALKYDASQAGVRLSFALSDWVQLGAVYFIALEELRKIRDEDENTVREMDAAGKAFPPFMDFAAINKALHDEAKTTALFQWLDTTKPEIAKSVFPVSEEALIKAKEYQLCGKYVDPQKSFGRILGLYKLNKGFVGDPRFGTQFEQYTEEAFSHSTTTLVALLAVTNRKEDADRVVTEAEKEWDDAKFKEQLEEAQQGNVPAPWP
jgi:hypothetical protein